MPGYKEKKQKLKQLVKKQQQQRIKIIEQQGHKFVDTDAFKRAQKHYKYYIHRHTDFSKVIKYQQLQYKQIQNKKVYIIPSPQGAYLVKNFSNIQQQYQIGFQALNRYIYRPYRTNLDGTNGLYEKQQHAHQIMQQNLAVQPQEIKDQNNNILYYFNQKIRMANLGYQYDWPKRSYPSTKVPVPDTILTLTQRAKNIYEQISKQTIDYYGQAVIVNYYKVRDYMIGHLDDGQIDQKNPIFSYCYGLSCIFLLGYPQKYIQKQKQPIAIQLQAGDLLIMSGYSRICYHGVPRIIENSYKIPNQQQMKFQLKIPNNSQGIKFINYKQEILNYFKCHRLNVNIRQVYPSKKQQVKVKVEQITNKNQQIPIQTQIKMQQIKKQIIKQQQKQQKLDEQQKRQQQQMTKNNPKQNL